MLMLWSLSLSEWIKAINKVMLHSISHIFNILDARGVISVAQRAEYIGRIRDLAKGVGQVWLESQK